MKKLLLICITALLALEFQSCKKSKVDEPVPVIKYTYANSRIKQLNIDGHKSTEFIYDVTTKKLTSAIFYDTDPQTNITAEYSSSNFEYNTNGKLAKRTINSVANQNVKNIHVYSYSNDILQSFTYSTLNTSTQALILNNSYEYAYDQTGRISTITFKDGNGLVTLISSYQYTTANGNPQVTIHYEPVTGPPYDATSIYYANIIDPDPLNNLPGLPVNSPFMLKDEQVSSNLNYNYQVAYETDPEGKIKSYTETYPNPTPYSAIYTYIYELK